jgi:hypothetical protein
MRRCLTILLVLAAGAGISHALPAQDPGTMITVYNQNLALVRQVRSIPVEKGDFSYRFVDVAAKIDPTSVSLEALSGPPLTILEQNYAYDLINSEKVLQKSIGLPITFFEKDNTGEKRFEGTLLAVSGGRPVIRTKEGIYIGTPSRFLLPKLPPGLIMKPTLLWMLRGRERGTEKAALSYLTGGMNWKANYVLSLAPGDRKVNLTGWVTVDNQCGVTFQDARLKLLAGDVHRAAERRPPMRLMTKAMAESAPQFKEHALFEYHLYTLQRPTTLQNNETKQIELVSAPDVPVKKVYIYDGANMLGRSSYYYGSRSSRDLGVPSNTKVDVRLEFKNNKASHLGIPLPAGTVRVFKNDTDGTAQFIGEDSIDHTPKDEMVRIKLGEAFDIVGQRKETSFHVVSYGHVYDDSFEITLRNHKDEAVEVRVAEVLYRWSNWKIIAKSDPYQKVDAQTIVFPVKVPANGEKKVTYTVQYSW